MKYLRQLGIVLFIAILGEVLSSTLGLPIPGSVLGMVLLLIALLFKVIKLDMVEGISNILLTHLPIFFIPAGVSLLGNIELLKLHGLKIILISVISTILVIITTGLTITMVKRVMD